MLKDILLPTTNQENQKDKSCFRFLTFKYYQKFFNVKTADIAFRLQSALFPFSTKFALVTKDKPDLYGPFWVLTTLVFTLACAGNFSSYISAMWNEDKKGHSLHFDFVPTAATLVYGFGFAFPVALALLMRFFGSKMVIAHVICVYGYSLTTFIPVSMICAIPSASVQWFAMMYGIGISTIFLLMNFNTELKEYIPNTRYIVLGFILFVQFLVFITFRSKFFSSIYKTNDD